MPSHQNQDTSMSYSKVTAERRNELLAICKQFGDMD